MQREQNTAFSLVAGRVRPHPGRNGSERPRNAPVAERVTGHPSSNESSGLPLRYRTGKSLPDFITKSTRAFPLAGIVTVRRVLPLT